MDSKDNHKQITKLINSSVIQPCINKLNLGIRQKYMLIGQVEMEKKCISGKRIEIEMIETDCYCNYNKDPLEEGISTFHSSHNLGGLANHCWLPKTQSQCFYYCHKLSTVTGS